MIAKWVTHEPMEEQGTTSYAHAELDYYLITGTTLYMYVYVYTVIYSFIWIVHTLFILLVRIIE